MLDFVHVLQRPNGARKYTDLCALQAIWGACYNGLFLYATFRGRHISMSHGGKTCTYEYYIKSWKWNLFFFQHRMLCFVLVSWLLDSWIFIQVLDFCCEKRKKNIKKTFKLFKKKMRLHYANWLFYWQMNRSNMQKKTIIGVFILENNIG